MASTSERIYVARPSAAQTSSVAVATVAATAKTIVGVIGSSTDSICLKGFSVSFASVTATDVPALIEIGIITALGTSTSTTPVQTSGHTLASSATAGYNHTVEPTYNRVFRAPHVPVNNGVYEFYYPLGEEPQCDISQGFAMRITSPQAQSVYANLIYSE
jgi:hypothetical protein